MIKLFIKRLLGAVFALLVLFEEWGWEPLQRFAAWVARWPPLAWAERRIANLPPRAALVVFALPSLALLPVKLGALWLISHGLAAWGLALIVAAKLLGTALVARLFKLTQPALMQLPWFARLYTRWIVWKAQWLAWVRASWAWRVGRVLRRRWQQRWARWRGRAAP